MSFFGSGNGSLALFKSSEELHNKSPLVVKVRPSARRAIIVL